MKYYSEKLHELFDTEEALFKAERADNENQAAREKALAEKKEKEKKLTEVRKIRAQEVEEAYKVAEDAHKKADDLMRSFLKDYGSYHTTFREVRPHFGLFDLLESIFR